MNSRFLTILFAVVSIALITDSCERIVLDFPQEETAQVEELSFYVSSVSPTSAGVISKTSLKDDGKTVLWSDEDKIGVANGDGIFTEYTIAEGVGESAATFTGFLPAATNSGYYGIYPHSSATISGNVISGVVVPKQQLAIDHTYDPTAAVMTAHTTTNTMVLKHLCSFLKIEVGEGFHDLIRVSVESNDGTPLTGTVRVSVADDGTPTVMEVTNASKKVMLTNDGDDIPEGVYYLAILPNTSADGYKVRFESLKTTYIRTVSKSRDFERSKIRVLGKFEDTTEWTDKWTEKKPQSVLIGGEYSVSPTESVYLATGNLQAVMKSPLEIDHWQLASEQYEYIGGVSHNSNSGNEDRSNAGAGKIISLFSWTSKNMGYTDSKKYGAWSVSNNTKCLSSAGETSCDWGEAYKQSSGSDYLWRVPSTTEWSYLLAGRGGYCSSVCTIEGTRGILIYPNSFDKESFRKADMELTDEVGKTIAKVPHYKIIIGGSNIQYVAFNAAGTNSVADNSATNFQIPLINWHKLEKLGCMFLPCEGYCGSGGAYSSENLTGLYHCSDVSVSNTQVRRVQVSTGSIMTNAASGSANAYYGMSIRLIAKIE